MTLVTSEQMATEGLIVRATVNIRGLRVGDLELVDPDDPEIAVLLEGKYIVPDEASAELAES